MKWYSLFLISLITTSIGIIHSYCEPSSYTELMKSIAAKEPASVIRDMIDSGEDVNAVDCEFLRRVKPVLRYALDRGSDKESIEIIRMLIASGADVNKVTYNRVTEEQFYGFMPLLTYATIYCSPEIVQLLVSAGAQDTKVSSDNTSFQKKSALEIARDLGRTHIIHILENAGK